MGNEDLFVLPENKNSYRGKRISWSNSIRNSQDKFVKKSFDDYFSRKEGGYEEVMLCVWYEAMLPYML